LVFGRSKGEDLEDQSSNLQLAFCNFQFAILIRCRPLPASAAPALEIFEGAGPNGPDRAYLVWLGAGRLRSLRGLEAGAAINRPALRRIEGNRRLLSALRADDRNFDALSDAREPSCGDGGESLILCLLARLATLRCVRESFVMIKDLLACRPNKVFSAVDTLDGAVFKFC
jgi:hypothetical protein